MQDLWKQFGRESDTGKQLFSLYKAKTKPVISYPKPRLMTEQQKNAKSKAQKKCPQKTQIEYPQLPSTHKGRKTYHPIDFVPKRKTKDQIDHQIKTLYKDVKKPMPGIDRSQKIADLQQKFQFKDLKKKPLQLKKQQPTHHGGKKGFIVPEYAQQVIGQKYGPGALEAKVQKIKEDGHLVKQKDEYEVLFDQIAQEIEERQQFLQKMNKMADDAGGQHLRNKQIEKKIKAEISQRISELEKLSKLRPQ